jgi:hypothetical protein
MTRKGSEKQLLEAANLIKIVSIHFIIKLSLSQICNMGLMSLRFSIANAVNKRGSQIPNSKHADSNI